MSMRPVTRLRHGLRQADDEEEASRMAPAAVRASREATTSVRGARQLLISVLLLSVALNVYQIWWGLPLSRPIAREAAHVAKPEAAGDNEARPRETVAAWGTDEVAPMGPLVYLKGTFIDGSWFHKYPAFHFMLLSAAYAPVFAYFIVSGQLSLAQPSDAWPYGFKDPASSLSILL